jgi:hypothetical protein
MANIQPPTAYAGTPAMTRLLASTVLYRVHLAAYPAHAFNPVLAHRYYGGGRFDATDDDRYPYLYAGESLEAAIAEMLLRDLPCDSTGARHLPRRAIQGRRISTVITTTDLDLVSLRTAADLGAVCQDAWLTSCEPTCYAQSRFWAHWIRAHAPTAAGLVWMSHREPTRQAFVLFGDRTPGTAIITTTNNPALPPGFDADFDTPGGRRAIEHLLATYNVVLGPRQPQQRSIPRSGTQPVDEASRSGHLAPGSRIK